MSMFGCLVCSYALVSLTISLPLEAAETTCKQCEGESLTEGVLDVSFLQTAAHLDSMVVGAKGAAFKVVEKPIDLEPQRLVVAEVGDMGAIRMSLGQSNSSNLIEKVPTDEASTDEAAVSVDSLPMNSLPMSNFTAGVVNPLEAPAPKQGFSHGWFQLIWMAMFIIMLAFLLAFALVRYQESRNAAANPEKAQKASAEAVVSERASLDLQPLPELAQQLSNSVVKLPSDSDAADDEGPPPVCPNLVLPSTEAAFMLPLETIQRPHGSFDMTGPSGRKIMNIHVVLGPNSHRCIAVSPLNCDEPRCVVHEPKNDCRDMEVQGRSGTSYGLLRPASRGYVLQVEGQAVMHLQIQDRARLIFMATTMRHRVLATAGPISGMSADCETATEGHVSADLWRLQIKPGIDAVLLVSCMLALSTFEVGKERGGKEERRVRWPSHLDAAT